MRVASSSCRRNAHERTAIFFRPRNRGGRLVARHQPLVRIHQRVGHRAKSFGVAQQAGDVVQACVAQVPLPLVRVKRVRLAAEERLMGVHARPIQPENRLRHERRVQIVAQRHVLHDKAKRAHVVRRHQHVVVTEVDLVLPWSDFVMGGFDMESHLLERQHDFSTHVLAKIDRRKVEVARRVMGFGRWLAVAPLKQEELRLRSGLHREAAFRRHGDDPFERRARTSGERRPIRVGHVADDAADPGRAAGATRTPGDL